MGYPRSDELSGDHDARRTRGVAPPSGGAECATNRARDGLDRKTVGRYLEQAATGGVKTEVLVTDEVAGAVGRGVQARPLPAPSEPWLALSVVGRRSRRGSTASPRCA